MNKFHLSSYAEWRTAYKKQTMITSVSNFIIILSYLFGCFVTCFDIMFGSKSADDVP
jgi:hypothetical protein